MVLYLRSFGKSERLRIFNPKPLVAKPQNITIYPNPSEGIYNIDLSQVKEPRTITKYNVLGELVYKQLLTPQIQNQIDISNLANGYYIARIKNESLANNLTKLSVKSLALTKSFK